MRFIFIVLFTFITLVVIAQNEKPGLITDRPDQTESAAVIPLHSLQIETGFLMTQTTESDFKTKSFAYNSTLLRYGLAKNLELRLGIEILGEKFPSGTESVQAGFSPLYTGAKIKITEEKGLKPDIAILGGFFFPITANEEFKPEHIESVLRLAFAHTLSDKVALGYNIGSVWDGTSATPDWIYSVSLGFGISKRLGMFLETYGAFPCVGETEHLVDTGFTFLLRPNLQLDASGGLGIYNGVDHFLSIGLTWRIPE